MKRIAVFYLACLAACQSPKDHPSPVRDTVVMAARIPAAAPDTTTLGGTWYLVPVLTSDTAAGKRPVLVLDLDKTHFAGNTGCNSMHGKFYFSKQDSSISFSNDIMLTKMSCPGYNEQGFLKSLRNAGRFRLHNGELTLLSDNNSELSRWTRKPTAAPKALKA